MPFVSVRTTAEVTEKTMSQLQEEIGNIISVIPGKNIHNCMTHIEGSCDIFMSGKPEAAVFCDIRMFGHTSHDKKAELIRQLHTLFVETLGTKRTYTNIVESEEFGIDNNLKAL